MDGGNGAGADVPPANLFVVGSGDQNVGVRTPYDGFDMIIVNARTDFVAGSEGGSAVDAIGARGGGRGTAAAAGGGPGKVEDSQLLFIAAGCKELGIGL